MASTLVKGVGIGHLPNQRHKIVTKRGAKFTIMVCGESGVGKTTFVNTLFATSIKDPKGPERRRAKQVDQTVEIEVTKEELEEKGFKVKLTVIDTPGFGDYVNNSNSWMPIVEFIDDQHEAYLNQERQPIRQGMIDLRVHACLYFIRPNGHTLKPLDVKAMKELGSRVNLIPVIAKADTLTPADLQKFKRNILEVIQAQEIQVYQCPIESDDEAVTKANVDIMAAMPFAVIGSTEDVQLQNGQTAKGRAYTWGVAEVENEDHCDFKKLRTLLIRSHMHHLISTTEEEQYEHFRETYLEDERQGKPKPGRYEHPKFKKREEGLRSAFTDKVRAKEVEFRHQEKTLIDERDKLNKELEGMHAQVKDIEVLVNRLSNGSQSRTLSRR